MRTLNVKKLSLKDIPGLPADVVLRAMGACAEGARQFRGMTVRKALAAVSREPDQFNGLGWVALALFPHEHGIRGYKAPHRLLAAKPLAEVCRAIREQLEEAEEYRRLWRFKLHAAREAVARRAYTEAQALLGQQAVRP